MKTNIMKRTNLTRMTFALLSSLWAFGLLGSAVGGLAVAEASAGTSVRLIGLIKGPVSRSMAVLEINREKVFLKIGDQARGYRLESIDKNSAKLFHDQSILEVFYDKNAVVTSFEGNSYETVAEAPEGAVSMAEDNSGDDGYVSYPLEIQVQPSNEYSSVNSDDFDNVIGSDPNY